MTNYSELIAQLRMLDTETSNPDTLDLDRLTPLEICRKINNEDKKVAAIVEAALPRLAEAASVFADTIRSGHRVFYIGAGTSGRLGVLDAAECPPTFGTDPSQIVGVIAGGKETLVLSQEGVEDNRQAAIEDLQAQGAGNGDFVVGICASRRTPYTLAALEHARTAGCRTAFIICNRAGDSAPAVDVMIELPVGPEAITGSTRMKSGTAQKMALNIISTTAMVLLGKTLGNLMIDLQDRSEKLAARSRRMLIDLLGISLDEADKLLKEAAGSVKTAIVMHRCRCGREEALGRLDEAGGKVSRVLDSQP